MSFPKPSSAARTALAYITVGALLDVWTIVYWIHLYRHPEGHSEDAFYTVYGFFFTGLVLLIIGMALGRIGRSARHADLAPAAATDSHAVAAPQAAVQPRSTLAPTGSGQPAAVGYAVPAPGPVQPQAAVPVRSSAPAGRVPAEQ